MPHILVRMVEGYTEAEKKALADALTQTMIDTLGVEEKALSVAIEEFSRDDWTDKVYVPDIQAKPDTLYKKPGYDPFA